MYTCASMGLNLVPKVYTRVFKAFLAHMRKQYNICITSFLDDTAQISESRLIVRMELDHTILEMFKFGFVPSFEKSVLKPTQEIFHLG